MLHLRSALFQLWFFGVTFLASLLLTLALPLPHRVMAKGVAAYARAVLFGLRAIAGISHEIRGREHMPRARAIVAAKHQSAWETVAMLAILDDPVQVLKKELALIPFYGWHALKLGMIPVDRSARASALKKMIALAKRRIAQNRIILIFPQGTRVAPGCREEYKPGVAALYTQLGVPCVPVALNSGVFWPRRALLKKPGTIVVEFLPPIPPGLKREQFMALLESRIEEASNRLVAEALTAGK